MYKRKAEPKKKLKAVEGYLRGEIDLREKLEKNGISKPSFYAWVRYYQAFGREG